MDQSDLLQIVSNYKLQPSILCRRINEITKGEPFSFIIFIGDAQTGKSSCSEYISGIKHKIGRIAQQTTFGAFLSYCGSIDAIIAKHDLKIEIDPQYNKLHLFSLDTESLNGIAKVSKVIGFLFPLISISSVIIYSLQDPAIKKSSSLIKSIQFFEKNASIIVRVSKYPINDIENLSEDNYQRYVSSTGLYIELSQDDDADIMMIPEPAEMKKRLEMRKFLFKEIVKHSANKIWLNTETLDQTIQESLMTIRQDSFFKCCFNKISPEQYIYNLLSNEIIPFIQQKSIELQDVVIDSIPVKVDELFHQLIEKFDTFCKNYNVSFKSKDQHWNQINDKYQIIKTQLFNKYNCEMQKMAQEKSLDKDEQNLAKIYQKISKEIPQSANDDIKLIVWLIGYDESAISLIKSKKRQYPNDIRLKIDALCYCIESSIMEIIINDINKIGASIDFFIDSIVQILEYNKNKQTAKQILKGVNMALTASTNIANYSTEHKNEIPEINPDFLKKTLGTDNFQIIDSVVDEFAPEKDPKKLTVPHFEEKDYYQIYLEKKF